MSESRVHPRAPIELKVAYQRMNAFFADYTRDISKGGIFIKSDSPLELGTEFDFEVMLPKQKEPFHLRGRVQWVNTGPGPQGMGIAFVWENQDARIRFEAVVEDLMMSTLGETLYKQLIERGKRG
jgi:type IV pilus assembly protein PilZ